MSGKQIRGATTSIEELRLKGSRRDALLRKQVWFEGGKVQEYALAYINLKRCSVDHGRVLGFDSSHGFHHRHFMGRLGAIEFELYAALAGRFYKEVHEIWRSEDEEELGQYSKR